MILEIRTEILRYRECGGVFGIVEIRISEIFLHIEYCEEICTVKNKD